MVEIKGGLRSGRLDLRKGGPIAKVNGKGEVPERNNARGGLGLWIQSEKRSKPLDSTKRRRSRQWGSKNEGFHGGDPQKVVQQEFMSQGNSKEAPTSRVRSKAVTVRMNPKEFLSAKKKCLGVRMNSGGLKAYKKSTEIQGGSNEKWSGIERCPGNKKFRLKRSLNRKEV
ncbi:MAG: hypothetical protein ACRC4N_17775 [Gammaproteobacteria bacterium]